MAPKKKHTTKKKSTKKTLRKKRTTKKTTKKKTTKKIASKKKASKKKSTKKATSKIRTKKKTTSKKKAKAKVSSKKTTSTSKKSKPKAKTSKKKRKSVQKTSSTTASQSLKPVKKLSNDNLSLSDIMLSLKNTDFFASDSDECIEQGCDNPATTRGYCRSDYIKNWKEIKKKENLIKDGIFLNHIKQLVKKTPHLLGPILTDFSDDKNFHNVLKEMNIDASEDSFDDLDDDNTVDSAASYEKKSVNRPLYSE